MQVIRVGYKNQSFYARLDGGLVHCLDKSRGIEQPLGLEDVIIMPLAMPSKVVCLARNYRAHAEELGNEVPDEPLLFLKPPTTIIGPGQPIVLPEGVGRVDYEGELGILIGRNCKNVQPQDVPAHIFGYTCAVDVTARDLQKKEQHFSRAKGFDTFAPIGPWIETDVPDPQALEITTMVNGEVRQQGSTADMLFSVFDTVSFISSVMTLIPGDVVLTGTPPGVGPLAAGDEVVVDIKGVGRLSNPVKGQGSEEQSGPVQ